MSIALPHPHAASFAQGRHVAQGSRRGWRTYLVLAACLAPVCVPAGPGQTALLDFLSLPALAVFALLLLVPGRRIQTPLVVPTALIVVGSLLATVSAPSVKLAVMALAQDLYLFVWFLALVNVMRSERDLRTVRIAWMWAAVAVAIWAVVQILMHSGGSLSSLIGSRGLRPSSTLYNPNMLADYLVISLFFTLSLIGDLPRKVLLPVLGALVLGLLTTKSNGGMIALASGTAVGCVVLALASRVPLRPLLAALALVVGTAGFGAWLHAEWRVGDAQLEALRRHTFVGRMEHSSESRLRIWDQLERSYAKSPLGIGPGNSGALMLSIAERERPDSYKSKEAHSDYLAYAIERGPLGLLGLLLMTLAAFGHVAGFWKHSPQTGTRARRAALWTAAMAAALTASAVHSTVIEKLHFRHFWLLLAIVCASSLVAARRAARRESRLSATTPGVMGSALVPAPAMAGRSLRTGTGGPSGGMWS